MFEYHDRRNIKKSFDKIKRGYEEMKKAQQDRRLLMPYVWKVKGTGRIKKEVKKNDVVYIKPIQKLGVVKDCLTTQIFVRFINNNKKAQEAWYQKNDTIFLLAGSQFEVKEPPEHMPTDRIYPEKGKDE